MNEEVKAVTWGRVGEEKIVARLMEGEEERGRGECGWCWKVRESDDGLWELWAALSHFHSLKTHSTHFTCLGSRWSRCGSGQPERVFFFPRQPTNNKLKMTCLTFISLY